jgi:two-component SAPR family response regulator
MLAIARAQILLAKGKPNEAVQLLQPLLNDSELYLVHAALLDAYKAKQDTESALSEANWLAKHRGRAYAENNMQAMLMPLNAALSDIAQRTLDEAKH